MGIILLLLNGCSTFGLKSSDTATQNRDSTVPTPDFNIDTIEPGWGPLAGGTTVAIQGNGFVGDVRVSFGNELLETITILDEQNVIIVTPPSSLEGGVDVTVTSDLGEQEVNNGFVYSDDGPPDGTDTADTDDTDDTNDTSQPTGLTGGIVELWKIAYGCPECFGLSANQNLQILAGGAFHSPLSGTWLQWLPPEQSCYPQYNPVPLASGENIGDWIYLQGSANDIGLRFSPTTGFYENTAVNDDDHSDFLPYNLYFPDSSEMVAQALETPQNFTSLEPSGAFLIGAQNAFQQPFRRSNFALTWGPSGTSDSIVLVVSFYTPNDAVLKGSIVCHAQDTGGIGIDPTLLTNYAANDILSVEIYRMQFRESVLSTNGSTIEGIGAVGLVGTGVFRN